MKTIPEGFEVRTTNTSHWLTRKGETKVLATAKRTADYEADMRFLMERYYALYPTEKPND